MNNKKNWNVREFFHENICDSRALGVIIFNRIGTLYTHQKIFSENILRIFPRPVASPRISDLTKRFVTNNVATSKTFHTIYFVRSRFDNLTRVRNRYPLHRRVCKYGRLPVLSREAPSIRWSCTEPSRKTGPTAPVPVFLPNTRGPGPAARDVLRAPECISARARLVRWALFCPLALISPLPSLSATDTAIK